jgi:hypothetical protein
VTEKKREVFRKDSWWKPYMCPFGISNTLKSQNPFSLLLQNSRITNAAGHKQGKAEQVKLREPAPP